MGAEEHGRPPPHIAWTRRRNPSAPACPTLLHFPPPSRKFGPIRRAQHRAICAGQRGGAQVEGWPSGGTGRPGGPRPDRGRDVDDRSGRTREPRGGAKWGDGTGRWPVRPRWLCGGARTMVKSRSANRTREDRVSAPSAEHSDAGYDGQPDSLALEDLGETAGADQHGHRVGDRGQARRRPDRGDRAARRGSPADRGRARRRQDHAGQGAGPGDRLLGAPDPVHPGPAAQRHHRRQRLPPGDPRLRVQAGRDLRQRRRRRRDQPRLAQDPVRAARVHGGAPGHRRRRRRTCWSRRSSSSRPRTRSRWRAPTRCPRRSATGSWPGCRWATRGRGRAGDARPATPPRPRWTTCGRSPARTTYAG